MQKLLKGGSGQAVLAGLDLDGSMAFDWIAELAVRAVDFDCGYLVLFDGEFAKVIGSCGFDAAEFPRVLPVRALSKRSTFVTDLDKVAPHSPLVNGTLASAKTGMSASVWLHGEFVGVVAALTERRLLSLPEPQQQIMVDLADIAGDMIRAKASLKLMLADVYGLANR